MIAWRDRSRSPGFFSSRRPLEAIPGRPRFCFYVRRAPSPSTSAPQISARGYRLLSQHVRDLKEHLGCEQRCFGAPIDRCKAPAGVRPVRELTLPSSTHLHTHSDHTHDAQFELLSQLLSRDSLSLRPFAMAKRRFHFFDMAKKGCLEAR